MLAACLRCGIHFNRDGCHLCIKVAGSIAPEPLPFYSAGDQWLFIYHYIKKEMCIYARIPEGLYDYCADSLSD